MIPSTALALFQAIEAKMPKAPTKLPKPKGIPVKNITIKDGKIVKDARRTDVSTKIRQRKSKKVSVKRRVA